MKTTFPLLLFFAFLFSACEREYYIEYEVNNRSDRKLLIAYQKAGQEILDSNLINTSLVFFVETGMGKHTQNYIEDINELPVDFISVTDEAGNALTFDVMDFENWQKAGPPDNEGIGSVYLTVRTEDFEE